MNLQALREVDWTFREFKAREGIHGLHPYPAMMAAPVARTLICALSREGDLVLDPFCGSGTVTTEAAVLQRSAIGYDINPLALLIARVKTTPLTPERLRTALTHIKRTFHAIDNPDLPCFPNIEFWFKPKVICDLARLKTAIASLEDPAVQDFFKVVFSRVVRECSNTRVGEFKLFRIPEEKLKLHSPNVKLTFEKRAVENIAFMNGFYRQNHRQFTAHIAPHDSRLPFPLLEKSVHLMLTSPPYGDSRTTVAYGQFSRLSLQWLDLWHGDLDKESLGGRPKFLYSKTPTLQRSLAEIRLAHPERVAEVEAFYEDLFVCCDNIIRVLSPTGWAVFVVANRKVKGVVLETDVILAEYMAFKQFDSLETLHREIPHKRMPSKNSPSNVPGAVDSTMLHEHIVILRKLEIFPSEP